MSIDGLSNFRDTGGMPLHGGGSTRSGVLYRSDALGGLTPRGQAELAATTVDVVVDLRTPAEQQLAPDRLPPSRPFTAVTLSILEGAVAELAAHLLERGRTRSPEAVAQALAGLPTLGSLYTGMLQHGAAAFVEIARLIAASGDGRSGAVLVHCTAGKDRTGVATALMLEAAGAVRCAVVADYASSQDNLAGPWADAMIGMIASAGLPVTPELRTLVTATPPEAIEEALSWLDAEHGGAAGYLETGGLSAGGLARLRARLAG